MRGKKLWLTSFAVLLSAALSSYAGSALWNYDESSPNGPSHWGQNYPDCRAGDFQTPVNLVGHDLTGAATSPVALNFHSATMLMKRDDYGVTFKAEVPIKGFVKVGKTSYSLLEFHFHTPSENLISDQQYPAEIHFVTQDVRGNYLVLAVLVANGADNPIVTKLWRDPMPISIILRPKDWQSLFPSSLNYFTFSGSLTTPPCTHGLMWVLFPNAINASSAQLTFMQRTLGDSVRPVQPMNGRQVLHGVAVANVAN